MLVSVSGGLTVWVCPPVLIIAIVLLAIRSQNSSAATQATLHADLKHAYCSQRKLGIDRMECGGNPVV